MTELGLRREHEGQARPLDTAVWGGGLGGNALGERQLVGSELWDQERLGERHDFLQERLPQANHKRRSAVRTLLRICATRH